MVSSSTTKKFYTYDDIKLKLYIEVTQSRTYRKLLISGEASDDECFAAWESLLIRNSKATGDLDYSNYFQLVQTYGLLLAKYNVVKACILKLTYTIDSRVVGILEEFGYSLDLTSNLTYATTLNNASISSNNIVTKLATIQKQLAEYEDKDSEPLTIGKIIADINTAMKFQAIDSDVLLSEFNEYKALIQKQNGRRSSNR
jgi:hypothetical protein